MRALLAMTVGVVLPFTAWSQAPTADSLPAPRSFTLTAGFGNSTGGIGLLAEKYVVRSRLALFAGLGYLPEEDPGDANGVGVAAGLRGFTPGVKHRGFLELSVSELFVQKGCFDACERRYGPGLQAGWHFVTRGGFTLWLSGGVGVSFSTPEGSESVAAMGGLGLGYTWRRNPR